MSDFRLPKVSAHLQTDSVEGLQQDGIDEGSSSKEEITPVPLRTGYRSGTQLPTQAGAKGAGIKHLVSARLSEADRRKVKSAALKAILPNATSKTTFDQAFAKIARRGPEQLEAAAKRLEALAGPDSGLSTELVREAVLGPISAFTAKYADPENISTDNPLQALGRLLTKHDDDERFVAGATSMMAVLSGLAARGGDPEPFLADLHAADRTLNKGWLAHDDEGGVVRSKVDGMQREVRNLNKKAWTGVAQSIREDVLDQVKDTSPETLEDVRRVETEIDRRLNEIELAGQGFPSSGDYRWVRSGAKEGASAFAQDRARALIATDFVKTASEGELRELRDILQKTIPWNDRENEGYLQALQTVTTALVDRTEAPGPNSSLHQIHTYVSKLTDIEGVDDPSLKQRIADKIRGAAELAAGATGSKGEFDGFRERLRFNQLGDIAAQLPEGDPLIGELEARQRDRIDELVHDRLRDVTSAYGSVSQDSVESYHRDLEAYVAVLAPTLDNAALAKLTKDIESRFADLAKRMDRHQEYEEGMRSVSFRSSSRRRRSSGGMSTEMKVALITAAI